MFYLLQGFHLIPRDGLHGSMQYGGLTQCQRGNGSQLNTASCALNTLYQVIFDVIVVTLFSRMMSFQVCSTPQSHLFPSVFVLNCWILVYINCFVLLDSVCVWPMLYQVRRKTLLCLYWLTVNRKYCNILVMLSGRALDLRSLGRGFNSYRGKGCVAILGKLFRAMCLCHQTL